ncbi:MAG: S-layer homology domain-containing protein [bacterium]
MRPRTRLSVLGKRLSALGSMVLVIVLLCAGLGAGLALAFTDVTPGQDYSEAIQQLSSLGIVTGFPDGSFGPGKLVTRQQFAKMIVLTLGVQVTGNETNPFGDVENQSGTDPFYPSKYVAVCAANGITVGKTANTFDPYSNITRAQVMTMVVRAAPKAGVTLNQPSNAYYGDSRYTMRNFDDPNHGFNAKIAEVSGLLWGIRLDSAGVWDPWKNATRGEVAQILWRLRQKMAPPTTTTTEPPSTDPLVFDDFSDPSSGWATAAGSKAAVGYSTDAGGSYRIHVMASDWETASWWPWQSFDNVYFEAWAYPSQDSGSWEYGLVFRLQEDMQNLYELSVMGDDTARLWKRVNGQWTQMSQVVDLPPVEPDGWRYLAVSMVGDSFLAWVDDMYVGEFTDSTFATGKVGFYVGTFDASDFSVWFDDFALWPIFID